MPPVFLKEDHRSTTKTASEDPTPILAFDEKIVYQEPATQAFFGERKTEGKGVLYITTKNVIWLSNEDGNKGFSIDYPFLTMHAVSRDLSSFRIPCIYCQLDQEEEEEEEEEWSEVRFVPADANHLDVIYEALSKCAELNPDPARDEEGEFYFNEDEVSKALSKLSVNMDEERFADAEEDHKQEEEEEEDGDDGEEEGAQQASNKTGSIQDKMQN